MDTTWAQDWIARKVASAVKTYREGSASPVLIGMERIVMRSMARQAWADAVSVAIEHDMPVNCTSSVDGYVEHAAMFVDLIVALGRQGVLHAVAA